MRLHRSNRSTGLRALLLASITALVVTSFDAHAAPAPQASSSAGGQEMKTADASEFSARKKRSRVRRSDPAAGLAMMGMMVGTVGAVIAAQQQRDAYEANYRRRSYGYYGQPRPRTYYQPRAYQPRPSQNYNPHWHDRYQRIDPQNPNSANPTGVPRIGW